MLAPLTSVLAAGLLIPASASAAAYNNGTCGNNTSRVLLSFDDWPYGNSAQFEKVAKFAKAHDYGFLFFPLGEYNREYENATGVNLAQVARQNGQYVGNHTDNHPDLTKLSDAQIKWQIRNGVHSSLLRPPYGAYDQRVTNIAASLGYRICTWTIDTGDWHGKSGPEIRRYIMAHVQPGSVILMHMQWHAFNIPWLRATIRQLRERGLKLCRPWRVHGKVRTSPVRLPKVLPC